MCVCVCGIFLDKTKSNFYICLQLDSYILEEDNSDVTEFIGDRFITADIWISLSARWLSQI